MSKKHISYKFTMYLPVCKNQMDDLGGTVLYVFKVSIYGAYKTCVEWLMLLSLKFSEKKFTTIKFNRLFTNTETVTLTPDFPLNTLIDLEKWSILNLRADWESPCLHIFTARSTECFQTGNYSCAAINKHLD